ncbi:MAG: hypothetical protein JSR41_15290 [Proteobacteria bacterium]|nr:hypothetical protein [Pseudomonadota bacterium]
MDRLIDVLVWGLAGAALLPLLLLGLYVLADRLGVKGADRILDWTVRGLALQWTVGGLVNLGGGLAIAALGVWVVLRVGATWQSVAGIALVLVGLWRGWRGASVLAGLGGRHP